MMLLPKDIADKIPALYATESIEDPMVVLKFFLPGTRWTWYVIEYDGEDIFYGYVIGEYAELGYFLLSELRNIKVPFGFFVERDLYFKPKPLSVIKRMYR